MGYSSMTNNMSLQIIVIPMDRLKAKDKDQIIDLCSEAFKIDYRPFIESFGETVHIIGYLGNEIIGHALWLRRPLQVGDHLVQNAAYVEAVVTKPQFQRHGYGSAIMNRLHAEISWSDFGALATSSMSWYERLGWIRWLGPKYIQKKNEVIATPHARVMVYRVPGKPLPDVTESLTADWRPLEVW